MWINSVYPTFFLVTHRGLTHSLFFGFFAGIAVLYLASRSRVRAKLQRFIDFKPEISKGAVAFSYAGVVMHLLLDYTTTRGVPLLYPLETSRFSAEVFFYTDIYLTILSLIIIILLYKKIVRKDAHIKILVIFLIVFAVLGGIRIEEKNSALDLIKDNAAEAYPTMNIFDWYVLSGDNDQIKIYEYDGLGHVSPYNGTFSRMNIGGEDNLSAALELSGNLPQVKLFMWRAYSVAVNASYDDGNWLIEYYDPLQDAMVRDYPAFFRRFNGQVNVSVQGGRAFIS